VGFDHRPAGSRSPWRPSRPSRRPRLLPPQRNFAKKLTIGLPHRPSRNIGMREAIPYGCYVQILRFPMFLETLFAAHTWVQSSLSIAPSLSFSLACCSRDPSPSAKFPIGSLVFGNIIYNMESKGASFEMAPKAADEQSWESSTPRPTSLSDAEKQVEHGVGTTTQLKRRLQSRHLQMIAIGRLLRLVVVVRAVLISSQVGRLVLVCSLVAVVLCPLPVRPELSLPMHLASPRCRPD